MVLPHANLWGRCSSFFQALFVQPITNTWVGTTWLRGRHAVMLRQEKLFTIVLMLICGNYI